MQQPIPCASFHTRHLVCQRRPFEATRDFAWSEIEVEAAIPRRAHVHERTVSPSLIGGDFVLRLMQCYHGLTRPSQLRPPLRQIPKWVMVNYPRPDELRALIEHVSAIGTPEARGVLVGLEIAHGLSFQRAMWQPAPRSSIETDAAIERIRERAG